MHFPKALLAAALFAPFTGCDQPLVEDTGEVEETATFEGAVRADLLSSNTGLLWSTDLSLDMAILREVGTAFTFLSAEIGIWGQKGGGSGGPSVGLNNCLNQSGDSQTSGGITTTTLLMNDCFVGAERNRRMNGEVTAKRQGNNLNIEAVWDFTVGAVSLSGIFEPSWQNVNTEAIPEATFSLEAVSDGSTYKNRTFSVSQGSVVVSDRYETPPKYQIPADDAEGVGASLSWDNRTDRIDFGLNLKNSSGRYSGEIWGEYTGQSGQIITIEDGQLAESQEKTLTLVFSGAAENDTQDFQLTELKQTWGNQTASFTGEVSFTYETQSSQDIGDSSTSYGLLAYTITPLALVGADYSTTINGAIESALYIQDESKEEQEVWTFGQCEELSQGRDDQFGSAGMCNFNNAEGTHIGLRFSAETPSTGWVLVEKNPGQWLCRNLNSGEERDLGSSQDAPSDCLE